MFANVMFMFCLSILLAYKFRIVDDARGDTKNKRNILRTWNQIWLVVIRKSQPNIRFMSNLVANIEIWSLGDETKACKWLNVFRNRLFDHFLHVMLICCCYRFFFSHLIWNNHRTLFCSLGPIIQRQTHACIRFKNSVQFQCIDCTEILCANVVIFFFASLSIKSDRKKKKCIPYIGNRTYTQFRRAFLGA